MNTLANTVKFLDQQLLRHNQKFFKSRFITGMKRVFVRGNNLVKNQKFMIQFKSMANSKNTSNGTSSREAS